MLTVHLPKTAEAKPKAIEVKVAWRRSGRTATPSASSPWPVQWHTARYGD